MIVRPGGDGTLVLITQPDHARLAGALISAWDTGAAVPAASRTAVLFAIEQHDNGWNEVDHRPMLNRATGRPHDFTDVPFEVKQDIWPRGVERLVADSPLAAALVAQHAITLHQHRRAEAAWQPFFARLEQMRDDLLCRSGAATGSARVAFDRSYDLLYVGDVVSLVFCNRWTDPLGAGDYRVGLGHDDAVVIEPDPFNGASIRFTVPARAIPDRRYASDEDLQGAFGGARAITLEGVARGAKTSG